MCAKEVIFRWCFQEHDLEALKAGVAKFQAAVAAYLATQDKPI